MIALPNKEIIKRSLYSRIVLFKDYTIENGTYNISNLRTTYSNKSITIFVQIRHMYNYTS